MFVNFESLKKSHNFRITFVLVTVLLPTLVLTKLFDCFADLSSLLPVQKEPLSITSQETIEPATVNFLVSDWTGRINFEGTSVFLWFLCAAVVTYCEWVIWSRSTDYNVYARIGILFACLTVAFAFGYVGGVNGDPKSCEEITQPLAKDLKSGPDYVREKLIVAIYCAVKKPGTAIDAGYQTGWRVLEWNTIAAYTSSAIILMALSFITLPSGARDLEQRGAQLRWLLVSLSTVIAVGTVQLRLYFDWPLSLLKEETRKIFVPLASACTNYVGLTGSIAVFLGFLAPLLWWQYDVRSAKEKGTIASTKFRTVELIEAIALIAAPALGANFAQWLTKL